MREMQNHRTIHLEASCDCRRIPTHPHTDTHTCTASINKPRAVRWQLCVAVPAINDPSVSRSK